MATHPFTSRVVKVFEQDLERASKDASVTPTIPNKLLIHLKNRITMLNALMISNIKLIKAYMQIT
ncbi:hypothetical protein DsansV1_C03g0032721 [Dioscorea sansibarensis]